GGLMLVDYRGPAGTIPSISAARILEGEADPSVIAGKIVVVGVNATGYGTMLRTGAAGQMSRTEKIATVTANILAERYITTVSLSSFLDILILFVIGAFCAVVLPRVTLLNRIIILVMMALLFVNLNYALYNSFKLITKTLFPTLEIVLFLAFAHAIKPRDETARTEAVTGGHAVAEHPRKAATGPHASHPARVSARSGSTPIGPDGVPVRRITDGAPAGVISGLAKTMVIDLDTVRGAGFASLAPATASPPSTPPASSPPSAPPDSVGSGYDSGPDSAFDPDSDSDAGVVDMPPPVDISLAETMEAALPQGDTPQPRDLMDETPQPMGMAREGSTGGVRRRDGDITQLGRYEILGVLGQGAMGTVYKGRDPAIDRLVALKTIRVDSSSNPQHAAELRERLVREAKAAGKLSHPHIVTIYDVGTHDDLDYIAMEYLEGYTLEQMTRKNVQVNFRITAKMLIQVCAALDYAHTAGIVHRDIKPANIMVLDNFEVKVTDFGIARVDSPQTSMTQTGIAVGTPQYIAPELLRGEEIDRRCDIFSLGVVAYELLTRRRPFTGENISQLVYSITQKDPVPPSRVDPQIPGLFDVIVGKALAKNPRERYQNAREMGQALSSFVEDLAGAKSFRI
ncbi:MAG TPA: protein kinase, partial [Acidobacteriota bacterium]|nr:protein kinase [Acidobacteriota bacterium]